MAFFALTRVGGPSPSFDGTCTSMSLSSGRRRVTSSSRVKWPRSTHCNAATAVRSFVQDPSQRRVSSSKGFSKVSLSFRVRTPKELEYEYDPDSGRDSPASQHSGHINMPNCDRSQNVAMEEGQTIGATRCQYRTRYDFLVHSGLEGGLN